MDPNADETILEGISPAPIDISRLDPNFNYPVREFLDDQHQVIRAAGGDLRRSQPILQDPDGRSFFIHTAFLKSTGVARRAAARIFKEKYGSAARSVLLRFKLVVDFLNYWQREITRSGFAQDGQPIAVREEFLRYLLAYRVHPGNPRIPRSAIVEFLDDWGHRWF